MAYSPLILKSLDDFASAAFKAKVNFGFVAGQLLIETLVPWRASNVALHRTSVPNAGSGAGRTVGCAF
jgi:hypothetical protein